MGLDPKAIILSVGFIFLFSCILSALLPPEVPSGAIIAGVAVVLFIIRILRG